jgi:hypothetical protein
VTDTVTIRFSTSTSKASNWASAAIRRLNHSPFSHVDYLLPDGNLLGASDQGPKSPCIKGNPQGVAIRPSNYQLFGYRRDMVLKTDLADVVLGLAMAQLGKPFDSTALWDFLADDFPGVRDWSDPAAWFCAELKVATLDMAGLFAPKKLMWPKNRVSPTDLLLILQMDDRWINRENFWNPIPGLALDPGEK